MYTHICIGHPHIAPDGKIPKLKNGDFATFERLRDSKTVTGKAYEFKEDTVVHYDVSIFVELPKQKEKTVYVAVSEEVIKELSEPVLN